MSLQGPVWIRKRRGKREREKEIESESETEMWIRCPLDASHVLQHIQGGRD